MMMTLSWTVVKESWIKSRRAGLTKAVGSEVSVLPLHCGSMCPNIGRVTVHLTHVMQLGDHIKKCLNNMSLGLIQ